MIVKQVRTLNELNQLWPTLAPLLKKSFVRGTDNPGEVDDIHTMISQGRGNLFYVLEDDGSIPIAMALEASVYKDTLRYIVVALGGVHLDKYYDAFWSDLCLWMRLQGAVSVVGLVKPGMKRWLRKYKFEPVCMQMRLSLE